MLKFFYATQMQSSESKALSKLNIESRNKTSAEDSFQNVEEPKLEISTEI